MTNDLLPWIEERIDADSALDAGVGLLVLAALEGDAQLDAEMAAGTFPHPREKTSASASPAKPTSGAFLRLVQVAGFRGIGSPVTLTLEPAPGLTVVAGRNGSGKSSIAEGLELLLTGGTYRWKNKRSTQWSERWRNIHHGGPPEIDVEIVEEGSGPVRLRTRWPDSSADVNGHATTAQRTVNGVKLPVQDAAVLNWAGPLETYRPMLSYDELGGLLESGPSELYDALAKVLGTEQLADGLKRIRQRRDGLSAPLRALAGERNALQAAAAALDDERAHAVGLLLGKASPATTPIRELATGVTLPDRGTVESLRSLAHLQAPDPARIEAAANRLRTAVGAMAHAGESEAARRIARLDVRRLALRLHENHGDQTCPVCSVGNLDRGWAEASRDLLAREEAQLKSLFDARNDLDAARSGVRALAQRRPPELDRAPSSDLDEAVGTVRRLWDDFADLPDGDLDLADHLELHAADLESAVGGLRAAANAALAKRDDAWGPLAARIASWCQQWDEAQARKPLVDRLAAAEKWLKDNDTRLKNDRIAPISDAAKHAWALLRQESNVDLGELRLEGQATRRRVAITASIDGVAAGNALPVMSQGELHALALALFLPRATLDESPFRFVTLDDPVQAMDPAKVDGLVALLSEIARSRQVVVFSHDDRLPAAVRRANAAARIIEVTRGADSAVTVRTAEDPATRYLGDADALNRDKQVPPATLRRTLPGLLRMAIEAAARDRFYATRLTRGIPLADVEATWNNAHATRDRVSLAIYDDQRPLDNWLRGESRKKALGIATRGFHQGLLAEAAPADAIYHTRRMVDDIKAGEK